MGSALRGMSLVRRHGRIHKVEGLGPLGLQGSGVWGLGFRVKAGLGFEA